MLLCGLLVLSQTEQATALGLSGFPAGRTLPLEAGTVLPNTLGRQVGDGSPVWSVPAEGQRPEPQSPNHVLPREVHMPAWMLRLPPWMAATTPNIGSEQWKREQAESRRQERQLRRVIEGVCRRC